MSVKKATTGFYIGNLFMGISPVTYWQNREKKTFASKLEFNFIHSFYIVDDGETVLGC